MNILSLLLAGTLGPLALAALARGDDKLTYPDSRRTDFKEVLHGVEVTDPYRWLEDPDTPEARKWIEAQNKVTFGYLNTIPERAAIRKRLTKLWNYERYGLPFKMGSKYFWTRNDGLQPQSVLYVASSLKAKPKVLLDPNKLSKDGTIALSGLSVDEKARYLAYSVSDGGSDWQEWRVRDIRTGKDLSDKVKWAKFTGASWDKEGKGFYYSRYDAPKSGKALQEQNYYQKLYYHRLGTDQSKDKLIYERKDQKTWGFDGEVTEDGRYLVIHVWEGTNPTNRVFYLDLKKRGAKVAELLPKPDASYGFIGNLGTRFYFVTDNGAPLSRVIAIDVAKPDKKNWQTILPQGKDKLDGASLVGGKLTATYLRDAHSVAYVFDTNGKNRKEIMLPGLGSAGGFGGRFDHRETFYSYTSFNYPGTVFRYDFRTGKSEVFKKPKVDFDPGNYVTKQVFYPSKDGTRIPMFVTYRKGTKLDGTAPTMLYGYGGFRSAITPWFSVSNLVWMEMGGIYAVANIRGGDEYGKAWHDAGRLHNKQNVFDDFIAAGEWLIANKYAAPDKLAISGGSNGGLLVGAVVNQRPDLFAAALPAVGVMDMLRFHKWTIGWAWVSDYGSPDKKEDFDVLLKYSPYHNLKEGVAYPAVLVTTGDHDDRVVPAHSFKYAAALQHAQAGEKPVLIRIETRAGHGAGKPTKMQIEEVVDKWGFLVKALGMELPKSFGS
jgi:prolyl oligopeptidase